MGGGVQGAWWDRQAGGWVGIDIASFSPRPHGLGLASRKNKSKVETEVRF